MSSTFFFWGGGGKGKSHGKKYLGFWGDSSEFWSICSTSCWPCGWNPEFLGNGWALGHRKSLPFMDIMVYIYILYIYIFITLYYDKLQAYYLTMTMYESMSMFRCCMLWFTYQLIQRILQFFQTLRTICIIGSQSILASALLRGSCRR